MKIKTKKRTKNGGVMGKLLELKGKDALASLGKAIEPLQTVLADKELMKLADTNPTGVSRRRPTVLFTDFLGTLGRDYNASRARRR